MAEPRDKMVLPHSVEAEKAVLGSIISGPGDRLGEILGQANLQPEQFFVNDHRAIYEVLLTLEATGQQFDIVDVNDKLRKSGFENTAYILDLVGAAPLTLNIEHYADIVRKNFYLRKVIQTCRSTIQKAMTVDGEVQGFVEEVEKEFLAISGEQEQGGGLTNAPDTLTSTLEELERRIGQDGEITGLTSGFRDLDEFTGGWQKSDLVILAARPGMGKTALALNWLLNAVKSAPDIYAAIFSLEMSKEQLMERLLSSEGRIDSTKLRKGALNEDEQDRLMNAARQMHALGPRLVVDETPGITLLEIRSRCRRYQKEHGLNMIIIDYLQLMSGSAMAQKQSREREISEISMGLKSLAKELAVPVIALAQLNRGPDARPDKKPKISDLRESGSMEQDADQIMFVYRDEYYNPESEHAGKAEVLVSKNRHGEIGSCFLAWQPNYVSFFNLLKE